MTCLCEGEQTGQGQSGERIQKYGIGGDRKNKEDKPGNLACDQILVLGYE